MIQKYNLHLGGVDRPDQIDANIESPSHHYPFQKRRKRVRKKEREKMVASVRVSIRITINNTWLIHRIFPADEHLPFDLVIFRTVAWYRLKKKKRLHRAQQSGLRTHESIPSPSKARQ